MTRRLFLRKIVYARLCLQFANLSFGLMSHVAAQNLTASVMASAALYSIRRVKAQLDRRRLDVDRDGPRAVHEDQAREGIEIAVHGEHIV